MNKLNTQHFIGHGGTHKTKNVLQTYSSLSFEILSSLFCKDCSLSSIYMDVNDALDNTKAIELIHNYPCCSGSLYLLSHTFNLLLSVIVLMHYLQYNEAQVTKHTHPTVHG